MRIFEITDENLAIASLYNVSLDYDDYYQRAVDMLETLLRIQSPTFNKNFIPSVDVLIHELQTVIRIPFTMPDPDIVRKKKKARKMLRHLQLSRSKLKF